MNICSGVCFFFFNKSSEYLILVNFFVVVLFLGTLTENSDHVNTSPTLLLISLFMFALGIICLIVFLHLFLKATIKQGQNNKKKNKKTQ